MSVIEKAEKRLQEEIRQNDLGADNGHLLAYWAAYLDGARAQRNELARFPSQSGEIPMSAFNYVERIGFMAGKEYAEARHPKEEGGESMTEHSEVVKALLSASTVSTAWEKLMLDAAAAIEALQAELEKKRTADCWGCKCEKVEPPQEVQL